MFAAIIAIAVLQAIVVLAVLSLLVERFLRNYRLGKIDARLKSYEQHIWSLLLNPTDISPLQKAIDRRDRQVVRQKLLEQTEQLKGMDKDHMTSALERLGYVQEEVGYLNSSKWWRRLEAATNLGIMHSTDAVQPLIGALEDPNEDVRLAAVKSLGQLGTAEGVRVLLDPLEDENKWTRAKIVEILVSIGPEIESEIVPRMASSRNPVNRKIYVELCGHLRLLEGVEPLLEQADDADASVRASIAHSLGMIGHDSATSTLKGMLTDEDSKVRSEAAQALGGLGSFECAKQLQRALEDPDWQVRRNAGVSLSLLGPFGKDLLISVGIYGSPKARDTVAHIVELDRLGIPVIG